LFSSRCALTDNLIIVGAPQSKFNDIFTGKVYLYTSFPVSVNEEDVFEVKGFYLSQNYPNPFNPTTKIRYSVPGSEIVQIKVFDVLGKEIKTLLNEYKQTGTYEIEFDASNLTSGVYFYQLSAGIFVETKKMILLR